MKEILNECVSWNSGQISICTTYVYKGIMMQLVVSYVITTTVIIHDDKSEDLT